jgi:carotenoid cleavage dioxygenase-like enzyme
VLTESNSRLSQTSKSRHNFSLPNSFSSLQTTYSWIITDQYYVIPQNPAKLVWPDLFQFLIGTTVGTDIFAMEHDVNGAFLLVPRHDPNEPVHRVESDAFFNLFHFGPCYEEEKEMIIHGAVFDSYKFGGEMGFDGQSQQFDPVGWATKTNPNDDDRLNAPAPRLDKFVLDLTTFTLKERCRIPVIDPNTGHDVPVDMPQFNNGVGSGGDGKKCRYSYFLGACRPEGWFPFRSIVKTDLQTGQAWNWDAGDGQVVSEPMFVPRQPRFKRGGESNNDTIQNNEPETAEDDGFVLSIVHNAEHQTCRLVIWDSQRFGEGPIAESKLGDLMPWCVHGSWYPGYNP